MLSSPTAAALTRARLVFAPRGLEQARWVQPMADQAPVIDLAQRLRAAGVRPTELAQRLGVTPADVTEVLRGRQSLAPAEAAVVANVLGLDPQALSTSRTVAPELALELQQPRWRSRLEARAHRASRTLDEERTAAAEAVLTMAARATGQHRGAPNWAQLIADQVAGG